MPPHHASASNLLGEYSDFLNGDPSQSNQIILEATLNFIKREQLEVDKNTLREFLNSKPPREGAKSMPSLDELTERLELIVSIEHKIRAIEENFELDDRSFAALSVAPSASLRPAEEMTGLIETAVLQNLTSMLFLALFAYVCLGIPSSPKPAYNTAKSTAMSRKRSKGGSDTNYILGTVDATGKQNLYKEEVSLRRQPDGGRRVIRVLPIRTPAILPRTLHVHGKKH
ncbi:hypothetical protein B0T25DRAFT_537980 [Lasiosphaeria hispida]|uniref:Uncharacterized protein n=1 Tax=Lasiosphaeria hispida TaxID=260671 RepID=A0AAJ0HLB0_9PEZI|nr:hypothetical protein B0T25DRAFT_537980 [Lasiosphaeria hispida]